MSHRAQSGLGVDRRDGAQARQPPEEIRAIQIRSPSANGRVGNSEGETASPLCSTTTERGGRPHFTRKASRLQGSSASIDSPFAITWLICRNVAGFPSRLKPGGSHSMSPGASRRCTRLKRGGNVLVALSCPCPRRRGRRHPVPLLQRGQCRDAPQVTAPPAPEVPSISDSGPHPLVHRPGAGLGDDGVGSRPRSVPTQAAVP